MPGQRVRRQPQRTCIACRRVADKRDLVRVVATPDGHILADAKGKLPGRGAYVCRAGDCWAKVRRTGLWRHALRLEGGDAEHFASDLAGIDEFFAQFPEKDDRG